MKNSLLHQIALTLVPNIGSVRAKLLLQHFEGDAEQLFKEKLKALGKIDGIGEKAAREIKQFSNFKRVEEELVFIEKYQIEPLFFMETNYPKRLLHVYDAPCLVYYKGNANLNASKTIAIVGTRKNSDYGKKITEQIVEKLASHQILVLSGLAYGIDAIAHRAALKNQMPTVGVLAHGLDSIYPFEHTKMAKEMLAANGGLLTEFMSNTKPDRHNFPSRNRIVAALADATLVIETDIKGGSMITAELANGYHKDVFAVPGKTTDSKSIGCNFLIKSYKAHLITTATDIIQHMGWEPVKLKPKKQLELFMELTKEEKIIVDLLQNSAPIHIDALYTETGLTGSAVAAALLSLELQSVTTCLPGKLIKLN